jgi:hypothetical protein
MLGDLIKCCYGWVLGGDFPFWVFVTEKKFGEFVDKKTKRNKWPKIAAMDFNHILFVSKPDATWKKNQRDEGAGWLASMSSQRQPRCKEMHPSSGGVPWWHRMGGFYFGSAFDKWWQGTREHVPQVATRHDGRGWVGFTLDLPFYKWWLGIPSMLLV